MRRAMARAVAVAAAATAVLLAGAAVGTETRYKETLAEKRAIQDVVDALEAKDCALAARRLSIGLAAQHPGVFLLAGTMYEDGLCLRANWERAEQQYRLAHEGGHRAGRLRLLAGLVRQGRDPGTALWLAQQTSHLPLPDACRVPEPQWRDTDLFVATVNAWPVGRLMHCVHVAGVMAHLSGDVEYPGAALGHNLRGTVQMTYAPAAGTIQWRTQQTEAAPLNRIVYSNVVDEQQSSRTRGLLEAHLREVGQRALKRFPKPEGIDPSWEVLTQWIFTIKPQ